jgi:hypothetical protein
MKSRNIKKVSQALTTILEEHLGVVQTKPNIESSENDRLRIVEQKLESLQEGRSLTERNEKIIKSKLNYFQLSHWKKFCQTMKRSP